MSNLVLFSSGHDSFYCLIKSIESGIKTKALIFDYGQTNPLEIDNAVKSCLELCVDYEVLELPKMLNHLNKKENVSPNYYPGRNLVFLSVGCSAAEQQGFEELHVGFCTEDDQLFPDCRSEFVSKFIDLQNSAYQSISVLTPCLGKTKQQTLDFIKTTKHYDVYKKYTYSCYNNSLDLISNSERRGCGSCGACLGNINLT